MSEPNHNDSSTASVAPTLTLTVEPNSEWRFELEEGEALAVRLLPPSPPPNLPSDDSEFISDPSPVYIHSQPLPGGATWYPLYGELKSSLWFPYGGDLEICSSLIGEGPAEGKAPSTSYTSTSSILPKVRNLHLALEYRRIMVKRALAMSDSIKSENGTTAPAGEASNQSPSSPLRDSRTWAHRIMVVGPANSGKSTLMKNLVNLTLGSGLNWTPGVVSLDPGDSPTLLPGSITLASPSAPLPTHYPCHSLGSPPTTAPATTLSSDVLTLGWYLGQTELTGSGNSKVSFELLRKQIRAMGDTYQKRCEKDIISRASGLFIDTPSSFITPSLGAAKGDKTRYGLITETVDAFQVDLLIVIGNEKLTIEMKKLLEARGVTVMSLEKSSGVVDLDDAYRARLRSLQTKSYFYGEPELPSSLTNLPGRTVAMEGSLHPQNFTISWDDLEIYRVGEESLAPSSALPIGKQTALSATRLTRVDPSSAPSIHRLQNAILGLVEVGDDDRLLDADQPGGVKKEEVKEEATEEDEDEDADNEPAWKENIGWREICGFVMITRVDVAKRRYELLTPSPGKLPSKVAIAGNLEWAEEDV